MNTRGRRTLFKKTLDMLWHFRSFVATSMDAQQPIRDPVADMLSYLERTLTPLSKELNKQNQELSQIKGKLAQLLQNRGEQDSKGKQFI